MNIYDELINTIKRLILDDKVSSYQINKETGVSYGNINSMRRGERSIENLTLKNAEKLYNYQKGIEAMTNKTYIVDMNKQDKAVEIITNEYGSFYLYEISPEWLKDTDYILDLIKNEDLNSKFTGEEIEEPTQFEYTLQEVKDFLE